MCEVAIQRLQTAAYRSHVMWTVDAAFPSLCAVYHICCYCFAISVRSFVRQLFI